MASSIVHEISLADDRELALTTAILSAESDLQPASSLGDIANAIVDEGWEGNIDAMGVLHALIQSTRSGADEILNIIGCSCSGKEIVICVQESAERLSVSEEQEEDKEEARPSLQLVRLMQLYTSAIPRVRTRKPASRTIQPTLNALTSAIGPASDFASISDGRLLVCNAALLVDTLRLWAEEIAHADADEVERCNSMLYYFLTSMLDACANLLGTCLARRLFEARFPRLIVKSAVDDGWSEGEDAIKLCVHSSAALGRAVEVAPPVLSISALLLLVHAPSHGNLNVSTLAPMFPIILTSLQTNRALEEALAALFIVLFPSSPAPLPDLSDSFIIPLSVILPELCSAHPDPSIRHLTLRILSRLLQLSPSALRLQVLRDLLAPSEDAFPQMRVAAIGLAKDFILDALGPSRGSRKEASDVFATPILLQTIGPFVFQPDPPDLLQPTPPLGEFIDSPESRRLVECLNLYYILLLRDGDNKTGIRDSGSIKSVESSLLQPLRDAIKVWLNAEQPNADLHASLPLASLEMTLARVDEVLSTLSG